jgi:predicted choloylglycine hydrolase
LALACLLAAASAAQAAEQRLFREGKFEKAELRYINDLPVLIVEGTPEEIGRQKAALTGEVAKKLSVYPKRLLQMADRDDQWPKLVEQGKALLPHFPPDYREELRAFAEQSGLDRDLGILANTLADTYRGSMGCSSLIVAAGRSATRGPLFGRNLDFYTVGMLDTYGLVTVHRPKGKHAFVSVGFPGLFGCLSGMNDAGLTLAVHEVLLAKDRSPMFNPKGVPYTFCFRRMLEECTTIEEAEKLLRSTERTTRLNLAVCDRRGAAVLEMTPETVADRHDENGICICTNHFRTRDLAVLTFCYRYNILSKNKDRESLDVAEVARQLHAVNKGPLTVQTMIFEPAPLVLHLAMGSCPASALPLKTLDLKPFFKKGESEEAKK